MLDVATMIQLPPWRYELVLRRTSWSQSRISVLNDSWTKQQQLQTVYSSKLDNSLIFLTGTSQISNSWLSCQSVGLNKNLRLLTFAEELLSINDELNNVFLRYDRYKRLQSGRASSSQPESANTPAPPAYEVNAQLSYSPAFQAPIQVCRSLKWNLLLAASVMVQFCGFRELMSIRNG